MKKHNKSTGDKGEQLAADWLVLHNYEILQRNWRYGRYEIDIIAQKNNTIHFLEVKTRTNTKFGHPEEAVTKTKFEQIKKAANEYLAENITTHQIQFDIISILIKDEIPVFFLIEDVYM